jgi:hypothetical protein
VTPMPASSKRAFFGWSLRVTAERNRIQSRSKTQHLPP